MKAITLRQPWASLIFHGYKTYETRPSPPNGPMRPYGVRGYPGLPIERGERIAIHAAASTPVAPLPHGRITWDLIIGQWTDEARHANDADGDCECVDPEDGDWSPTCWALNDFRPAILRDEGAHGWSLVGYMPLGAIVATAVVDDALPIVGNPIDNPTTGPFIWSEGPRTLTRACGDEEPDDLDHELLLGDFTPGRWGWLLTGVEQLAQPIPHRGRQGVWSVDDLEVTRG